MVSPGSYLLGGKEIENMNTDQSKNYLERQNFKTDEMNSLISSDKLYVNLGI